MRRQLDARQQRQWADRGKGRTGYSQLTDDELVSSGGAEFGSIDEQVFDDNSSGEEGRDHDVVCGQSGCDTTSSWEEEAECNNESTHAATQYAVDFSGYDFVDLSSGEDFVPDGFSKDNVKCAVQNSNRLQNKAPRLLTLQVNLFPDKLGTDKMAHLEFTVEVSGQQQVVHAAFLDNVILEHGPCRQPGQ